MKDVPVSEDDILIAARDLEDDILAILLDARKDTPVSEDLAFRFLEKTNMCQPYAANPKPLFNHSNGLGITERMLMTWPSHKTLSLLLKIAHLSCKISRKIQRSQRDPRTREELLRLKKGFDITRGIYD